MSSLLHIAARMPQTHQIAVHRIEVRRKAGLADPRSAAALRQAQSLGLESAPTRIDTAGVYLIQGALDDRQVRRIADELLADPVTETAVLGAVPPLGEAIIEVHPLPGVTDPDAEAVQIAIRAMLGIEVEVRTGRRYDMAGTDAAAAQRLGERCFANPLIHAIHTEPYDPPAFPQGSPYELRIVDVPLRDLSDAALVKLSRQAHLFLSLAEMKAIQAHYRSLGREPRDIELETLAQTWSEHCVHKTFKATIQYRETPSTAAGAPGFSASRMEGRPGHEINADGSVTIRNLLRSTIAAATHELIADGVDWCLSVFVDNAGVIAFDEAHAVCFKVETHNHPSALEPYGGAATGIGGCIRDVIGTGLAANPIAATDVFCVAYPDHFATEGFTTEGLTTEDTEVTEGGKRSEVRGQRSEEGASSALGTRHSALSSSSVVKSLPKGVLPPRRILTQVVAGVRDYGNRMGIPTLNGAVWFDDEYVGNPLVFCGCVGVMPRDKIRGSVQSGDRIVALGGRTGRDGIHGATFSSAELTDTHADEFSHAVQIGNAITEKKLLDAILAARDFDGYPGSPSRESDSPGSESRGTSTRCLFNAITDCGAGGFSSAVGEMGRELGAHVHLDRAPLKYDGLSPTEIWISEAQERMVLAVPSAHLNHLQAICRAHDVEMADLGHFGTERAELILEYRGTEVGRLSMQFLHEGLPETVREATWSPPSLEGGGQVVGESSEQGIGHSLPKSSAVVLDSRRGEHVHPPPDPLPQREGGPGLNAALLALLAHPNIASKHWIIRQYDHEVQGGSVIKPLVGPLGDGPSDAAVILPVAGSQRGLAIACGLAPTLRDDPYVMALAAIDECVRNLVCVGADPARIAILDNFCWPGCEDPGMLGALVRAAEGCYDGAKAYRTPFISGKDSLNNQFTTEDGRTIRIPPTLLISGLGIVPDVRQCITMDAKRAGNALVIVMPKWESGALSGSHYEQLFGQHKNDGVIPVDLVHGPRIATLVHEAIKNGLVVSAHDCSDGGILVAAAEMAMAGGLGLDLAPMFYSIMDGRVDSLDCCFGERPSAYLLEVDPSVLKSRAFDRHFGKYVSHLFAQGYLGVFDGNGRVHAAGDLDVSIDDLRAAWQGTLDW